MRKITPVAGQAGLFPEDHLDGRRTPSDNGTGRTDSTRATKGSPASRCITYWLAGRKERPASGVIAGVGRAIKRCFELNPDLTERDMRDAIDSLMLRGLDISPRQYFAACGVIQRPQARRDYAAQPTWKHLPKRSSMNERRRAERAPSVPSAGASPSVSPTTVLRSSSNTSPTGGTPAPTPATSANTAVVTDRTPAPTSPIDTQKPVSFKIERIAEAPPTNAEEEYRHVRFQETQSLDRRPGVTMKAGLAGVMAWLKGGNGDGSEG